MLRALAEQLGIAPEELVLYAAELRGESVHVARGRDRGRTRRLKPAQRTALLEQLQRYLKDND